jgi:hypothetical protein
MNAQGTQLNPGDIAIIAFQSDNNDQFAFLSLVDIAPNTQIHFSEKGWNGSLATPAFVTTSEGVHTWTAPINGLKQGTVVTVNFNNLGTSPLASYGSISSTSAAKLSTSGDELIAFQGSSTAPNFIYAFGSRPWIISGIPTSNQSWLPATLVNGITAKDFPTENDDQYYNIAAISGSKDDILASIGNTKNWSRSNARFTSLPVWHFQLLQNFYLLSIGDPTKLESWGTLLNGTGNKPDSFVGNGKIFHLANRIGTIELPDNWRLEKLLIEQNLTLSLNGFQLDINEFIDTSLGLLKGSEESKLIIRGKSGILRFDSNAAILNYLELSPGATCSLIHPLKIISSNKKGLLLLGDSSIFTSNGNLVLCSSEKGSSMVQTLGNGAVIQGKVEVEKFIQAGKRNYRFMGHPFANPIALNQLLTEIDITGNSGSINGFTTTASNNPSAFWYNPILGDGSSNDPGWIAFTKTNGSENNAWASGQGIRINLRGKKGEGLDGKPYTPSAVTLHLKDSLNIGNQTITLNKNSINTGFNLVGNPFAADIDMSKLQVGAHVVNYYYLWDPYLGTMGGYVCNPYTSNVILPSFSAFFAQTTDSFSGNTIQFPEACKVSTSNPIRVLGANNNTKNQLALWVESDSIIWDKHLTIFNPQSTDSIDQNDARKMMNPELNLFSISSEKQKLCIDSRSISQFVRIPIGIATTLEKKFSISVGQFPELPAYDLFLIDRVENNKVLLKEGIKYTFQTNKQLTYNESTRFEIQILAKQSFPISYNTQRLSFSAFPNPSENWVSLHIHSPKLLPMIITLSNAVGQILITEKLEPQPDITHSISLSSMAAGMYFVSISNLEETIVQKIIKN